MNQQERTGFQQQQIVLVELVVGDIDVDKIEAKIKALWKDVPARANRGERPLYSVDDNDGFVYTKCNINIEYAIWASKMNGVSQEVISKAEYERRFGKTLN